ncbi:MAG TPA: hypothetical protein DHW71_01985, partial [Gammaproteobacteria bacterium]|nr:hypothetical protein [Gammaproteobacteria bacterium]
MHTAIEKNRFNHVDRIQEDKNNINNTELDIIGMFTEIWSGRKKILLSAALAGIISIIIVFTTAPTFKAETVLAPVTDQSNNLSQMLTGQLGGLANFAGVNLSGGSSKEIAALATLQSRKFIIEFIKRHQLEVPLVAKKWNVWSQKYSIDSDVYNLTENQWNNKKKPTDLHLYYKFIDIITISQDSKTQLITLSIEWHDPVNAAKWANLLVEDLNSLLAEQEKKQAELSVEYLEKKLNETQLVQMQQVTFQLIESQLKVVMLADA